ncbi:hypothetical protein BDGGKGIB_02379 [Nodularia sphaerocarpa UHCC 0038]|nr:hypothetical protein BDGGKGIB_02379 [Nodularia sphaerocarpa UHCC 0038]
MQRQIIQTSTYLQALRKDNAMSISSSLVIYVSCVVLFKVMFFCITCSGCVWVWERVLNKLLAIDCLMLTNLGFLIAASPLLKCLSVTINKNL